MNAEDSKISGKDLQLMKLTYRTIIENYYDNPNEETISDVFHLNQLAMQTISSKHHSDSLLITSTLEILKLKAKSHQELVDSVQETIIHMKNPMKIYIRDETLQECL